jgi:hypothetical protein
MKIPKIHGYIERRILINYAIDPDVAAKIIPSPFRPKLYHGKAIGGICLIRLKSIKPMGFPDIIGLTSENAAHRFAVQWEENGIIKEGVYIPRRDTSSKLNAIAGGRFFPGRHHLSQFTVNEMDSNYSIGYTNKDATSISIEATETSTFNPDSIFRNLENASAFFEKGCIGFSPNKNSFDGLQLYTHNWVVKPLHVTHAASSYFDNENFFPKGSIVFDNALLMTNIEHEWQSISLK